MERFQVLAETFNQERKLKRTAQVCVDDEGWSSPGENRERSLALLVRSGCSHRAPLQLDVTGGTIPVFCVQLLVSGVEDVGRDFHSIRGP